MKNSLVLLGALIFLAGCGRVQDLASVPDSETASLGKSSLLRVECLSTFDNSRNIEVRKRVTLTIQNNDVTLKRRETLVSPEQVKSVSTTITGRVNHVFDGTAVRKSHATVLLTGTSLIQTDVQGKSIETKPRSILIEYFGGKIKVTGSDAKEIFNQGNCRTAEAKGSAAG